MASTTVRSAEATRETPRQPAAQTGGSMSVVLDRAVEAYRGHCILEQTNTAYAALRPDPDAWAEELADRRAREGTVPDDRGQTVAGRCLGG